MVIGALAKAAYPNDLAHPYRIANKVCVILEVVGVVSVAKQSRRN